MTGDEPLADDDSDTGLLPDPDCLDLLASKRRRLLLAELFRADERTHSLESLARAVAQTEQNATLESVATHRVRVALHHVHLPRLDDAGVLDYDRADHTVRLLGDSQVRQWLAGMDEL